jgi:hypothetical protein
MDCRGISAFTRVFNALCPAMTPAVLRITPRADGSHVGVAVFIVNNRPETMERIRPHVEVGSSHDAAAGRRAPVSRAQSSTKWCAADPGPFQSVAVPDQRCTASLALALHRIGTRDTDGPDSSFLSHDVKQPYSTRRRSSRRLKSWHRRAAQWGAKATRPAQ